MLHAQRLRELDDDIIDWRYKGFPTAAVGRTVASLREGDITIADFTGPIMVLRQDALQHNLRWMKDFCASHDALLAPHVKTTMSPQLASAQLEYGAWAVTVATVAQAKTLQHFGATRFIIANQVHTAAELEWIVGAAGQPIDALTLVDSVELVERIDATLSEIAPDARLRVLLEIGYPGGRAGVRTDAEAVSVAQAVAASRHLELAGLEGFEGVAPGGTREAQSAFIAEYLLGVRSLFERLRREGLLSESSLVSFGGSAYFDVVVSAFDPSWRAANSALLVLRSGCYLAHDHGFYARLAPSGTLQPALELHTVVTSTPEKGLALAAFGKRDVPTDIDLPVILSAHRDGTPLSTDGITVTAVNDQHAYLSDPAGHLTLWDRAVFGISHPCTAFDKWRLIPLVDADDRVRGAVHTFF